VSSGVVITPFLTSLNSIYEEFRFLSETGEKTSANSPNAALGASKALKNQVRISIRGDNHPPMAAAKLEKFRKIA
jgi:hypothetical protein